MPAHYQGAVGDSSTQRNVSTRRGRGPMPVHERLTLSPWSKWRRHGRIPWKFLTHIILTVLVTVQVFFLNNNGAYIERTQAALLRMLMPSGPDFALLERGSRGGFTHLYTYSDFARSLNFSMSGYRGLDDFIGSFSPDGDPKMKVEFREQDGSTERAKVTYVLSHPPFGPFHVNNTRQMKAAAASIRTADVILVVRSMDRGGSGLTMCWRWTAHSVYDFTTTGWIKYTFKMLWRPADGPCGRAAKSEIWWTKPSSFVFWLSISIILLAVFSLMLTVRAIFRSLELYSQAKSLYSGKAVTRIPRRTQILWENLSFRDKLRFFNLWVLITIIHDLFCITSSTLYLLPSVPWSIDHHWWVHLTMGVAAASAWIHVTQYFEYDKELSIFLMALRTGFPYIVRLAVAIGPVFLGYTLFGWTFFGSFTPNFRSFGDAAVSLFCIINGDDIHSTFKEYIQENLFVGRLFLVSFVMCFIYCVLNVFIYIMEEAVQNVKCQASRTKGRSMFDSSVDLLDDEILAELLSPFNANGGSEGASTNGKQSRKGSWEGPPRDFQETAAIAHQSQWKADPASPRSTHGVQFSVGRPVGSWHRRSASDGGVVDNDVGGLREPLLGGRGLSAVVSPQEEAPDSHAAVECSFILDQIFQTQERLQRQHFNEFSERLRDLEQDHIRMSTERQEQMMSSLARRIRKVFDNAARSQPPAAAPSLGRVRSNLSSISRLPFHLGDAILQPWTGETGRGPKGPSFLPSLLATTFSRKSLTDHGAEVSHDTLQTSTPSGTLTGMARTCSSAPGNQPEVLGHGSSCVGTTCGCSLPPTEERAGSGKVQPQDAAGTGALPVDEAHGKG